MADEKLTKILPLTPWPRAPDRRDLCARCGQAIGLREPRHTSTTMSQVYWHISEARCIELLMQALRERDVLIAALEGA